MTRTFFVVGIPRPKGSARSYVSKRGRISTVQQNKDTLIPWQAAIGWRAKAEGVRPVKGPVHLDATFVFPRPKGHFGKRGLLPSAPEHHTQKPDRDKLERAVLDALTGIGYADDSQVVAGWAEKRWAREGEPAGVLIHWSAIEEEAP